MFSAKKLIVIGFVAILLISIPITMYVLQQQQELRSKAAAATTLSFAPPSTVANPFQAQVGDVVDLDVMVNPNSNSVSFVRLEVQYDSTKLAPPENSAEIFEQNKVAFPVTNQPLVSSDGKIIISVSVQPESTTKINTTTKVGTIHLRALATTDTPTQVLYGPLSSVLSEGTSDQTSEEVLTDKTPAIIAIVESTISPSPSLSPSPSPSDSPAPTITVEPTVPVTPAPTATESATPNTIPVCSLFTADVASGSAPLVVNFSAIGNDTDGTIEKMTFNLGDGTVTSLTDNLGTASASGQLAHTYTSGGTFTASAVMTDNLAGVSTNSCSQTIIIAGPTATPSATITDTPMPTVIPDTPSPTLADTGPGAALIGVGAFFTFLSIMGAVLFFAL